MDQNVFTSDASVYSYRSGGQVEVVSCPDGCRFKSSMHDGDSLHTAPSLHTGSESLLNAQTINSYSEILAVATFVF